MDIFELVVSYFGTTGLHYELVTFFNISSQGEFRRRFTKFVANISQRHSEHVSLGMLGMFNGMFLNCNHWLFD